jgi:hypothetical protein
LILVWQTAVACESGGKPAIHVVGEPSAVNVAADFDLSDLSDLARRAGDAGGEAPLGFYTSTVRHTVSVKFGSGPIASCAEDVQIELDIELVGRRIEIGREVERQACRYSAALQHYQKKAAADREVFADYVNTIAAILAATPMPAIATELGPASDGATRHQIEQWVQHIVDQNLPSLRQARRAAFQAMDTEQEMRQLAEACSKGA